MYVFLILIFLTFACSHQQDYINKVDVVIHKEINKIYNEEGLSLIGYGGAMMNGIESINISLVSNKKVDVSDARRMIVRYIERIRDAVNAKADLQHYLIPYPFPIKSIELGIMFLQKNGKYIEYGCVWLGTGGVSLVSQQNGMLYYDSYNPRTGLLEDYFCETYEEALAIVKSENNGICNPPDHPRINQ